MDGKVRVHHVLRNSVSNGPGRRYVIWFQGCSLGCRGCFNPDTHAIEGGEFKPIDGVLDDIRGQGGNITGLTISGGEPFQQANALAALVRAVRRDTNLSTIVFSGYRMDEIKRDPRQAQVLADIDVLIAGRYVPHHHHGRNLLGSANQSLHLLSKRYRREDFEQVPPAEIQISPTGVVKLTGVCPPELDF